MMKKLLAAFALGFTLYIIYTASTTPTELVAAAISGIITAVLAADLLVSDESKLSPKRLINLFAYGFLYFTYFEYLAHKNVVLTILTGKPRISPAIVRVPYRVRSDFAITTIANSITNTPGTVVVDVDESEKAFYVHWLYANTLEESEVVKAVSADFEKWASKIFD